MSEGNNVEVSVRSDLDRVIADLQKIRDTSDEVSSSLKGLGKGIDDNFNASTKRAETYVSSLSSLGRRVARQLKDDFQTLLSINALSESFKLSQQFRGSIKESITLSDTIRKLGQRFNIAQGDFTRFQTNMVKGLGEIGIDSAAATNALQGLATTAVKGEVPILEYTKTSAMLASLGMEKGKEGDINRGMASVLTAKGEDPSNVEAMKALAEDLRRGFNATGQSPTQLLNSMEKIFSGMSLDFRKSINMRTFSNMAAAAQVAGPNATTFLEEYLGKSPIARMAFEAQGGKGLINESGEIDMGKFQSFSKDILGRIGMDPRMAAQTLGLSEDAAEGFLRLAESMDKVVAAQDKIAKSTGSVTEQYKANRTLGEAFAANLNRVKSEFAKPFSFITEKLTGGLNKASESTAGSAGVVLGGGILAALLAGIGTRGIGKGLGGGLLGTVTKGAAAQAITGKEVQPVYVVNASEIGGMGGVAVSKMLTGAGLLKAAGVAAAGYAGYKAGEAIQPYFSEGTQGETAEGFKGDAIERLLFKIDKLVDFTGTGFARNYEQNNKIIVETKTPDLKVTKPVGRGSSW